jgi:outer membrane protein OmpA-like peptidoglycan-associated protein
MASKQERINQILDDLEKKRHYDSDTSSMTRDGIVGPESEYSGITVVLKEAPDIDFASEISNPNGIEPKNLFSYNLNKIKYAIEQARKGENYDDSVAESLKKNNISGIGYVNLKKKAEEHYSTPSSDVINYAEKDGPYIKAELNTLESKVIYCAGKGVVYSSVKKLYPELDGKEIYNENGIHVFEDDGKILIIIDGAHPSDWSRFDAKKIHEELSRPEVKIHKLKAQEGSVLKSIPSNYDKDTEKNTSVEGEKESRFNNNLPPKPVNFNSVKTPTFNNTGSINPRTIAIIIGIIILIILLLLLLRKCGSSSSGGQIPSNTEVAAPPPVVTPPVVAHQPPELFSERTEKLFVKDSSELLPSVSSWLDDVARDLSKHIEQNPNSTFQVIGYTAVFPGFPDPGALSLERANKIISELVARKINANKLQAVSGGETNRWGNNIDESGRAPNRRIVIQERK